MKELTKEEFCELLGALPTNALVSNIYDTLIANKYAIVRPREITSMKLQSASLLPGGEVGLQFQDYTTKNNNNLTGHMGYEY